MVSERFSRFASVVNERSVPRQPRLPGGPLMETTEQEHMRVRDIGRGEDKE